MKKWKILSLVILPFFLVFLSTSIYMPNVGSIEEDLGNIPWIIPLTITTYLASSAVFQFFYGHMIDKYGRYKVYLPALLGFVIANILCYYSWDGISLVIFKTFQGATISCGFIIGAAVVSDIYPKSTRGKFMGIFISVPLLAPPLGSFLGGLFGEIYTWRSTFLFLAALGAISLVSITMYLPETIEDRDTKSEGILKSISILKRKDFLTITVLGLALMGTYYSFHLFFSLILDNNYSFSPFFIGLFLTVYGLVDSLFVYIGGTISDSFSPRYVLLVSSFLAGIGALIFALLMGMHPYYLLGAFLIFGIGLGLGTTPLVTYVMELFPNKKGSAVGVTNFVRLIGASLVPFGGYFIIKLFSETILFIFCGVLISASVILAYYTTEG